MFADYLERFLATLTSIPSIFDNVDDKIMEGFAVDTLDLGI
jgi:hypothetical protein